MAQQIANKMNTTTISIKKYLTLFITWISLLGSFWNMLPDFFKGLSIIALVLSFVECFTGIKPITITNLLNTGTQILENVKTMLPNGEGSQIVDLCKLGLTTFTDLYLKFSNIQPKTSV